MPRTVLVERNGSKTTVGVPPGYDTSEGSSLAGGTVVDRGVYMGRDATGRRKADNVTQQLRELASRETGSSKPPGHGGGGTDTNQTGGTGGTGGTGVEGTTQTLPEWLQTQEQAAQAHNLPGATEGSWSYSPDQGFEAGGEPVQPDPDYSPPAGDVTENMQQKLQEQLQQGQQGVQLPQTQQDMEAMIQDAVQSQMQAHMQNQVGQFQNMLQQFGLDSQAQYQDPGDFRGLIDEAMKTTDPATEHRMDQAVQDLAARGEGRGIWHSGIQQELEGQAQAVMRAQQSQEAVEQALGMAGLGLEERSQISNQVLENMGLAEEMRQFNQRLQQQQLESAIDAALGFGRLGLDRKLGLGQLGVDHRALDLERGQLLGEIGGQPTLDTRQFNWEQEWLPEQLRKEQEHQRQMEQMIGERQRDVARIQQQYGGGTAGTGYTGGTGDARAEPEPDGLDVYLQATELAGVSPEQSPEDQYNSVSSVISTFEREGRITSEQAQAGRRTAREMTGFEEDPQPTTSRGAGLWNVVRDLAETTPQKQEKDDWLGTGAIW